MGNSLENADKKKSGGVGLFRSNTIMMVFVLAVVVVIFSVLNGSYFSYTNFVNILNAATIVGMLAIGQTYLIIAGHIDLSSGTAAAMFGVVMALLLQNTGIEWPLAMAITLVMSISVGLINATLVNYFQLQPFIATLAMASVCKGIAYLLCNGKAVTISNDSFIVMGTGSVFGIPIPAIIMIVLFVVFGFILARTVFGRSVYMIGGNVTAARLAGLMPKKISTILYVISSCIAALAGIVLASRMHSGQPGAVSGSEFDAITAAVLGGVAFTGRKGQSCGMLYRFIDYSMFQYGADGH